MMNLQLMPNKHTVTTVSLTHSTTCQQGQNAEELLILLGVNVPFFLRGTDADWSKGCEKRGQIIKERRSEERKERWAQHLTRLSGRRDAAGASG